MTGRLSQRHPHRDIKKRGCLNERSLYKKNPNKQLEALQPKPTAFRTVETKRHTRLKEAEKELWRIKSVQGKWSNFLSFDFSFAVSMAVFACSAVLACECSGRLLRSLHRNTVCAKSRPRKTTLQSGMCAISLVLSFTVFT